jgi:anti-sigma factor RsiW
MSCERGPWLHGYFDGELDAARAAEFDAHLDGCVSCRTALEAEDALRQAIRGAGLYSPAPPSLQAKAREALVPSAWLPGWGRLARRALLATAAAALAMVVLWPLRAGRGADPASVLATEVLDAHLRSLQPSHLTDVVSSDQHTVKPWFDGRLDFAPPVRDLSAEGYPLLGGRLDVIAGRTVAALAYGRRQHVVNLFVWPAESPGVSRPSTGSARGYQWVEWTEGGMRFWAISDVAADDLADFVRLAQGAGAPDTEGASTP